jgi:hypothetical protein
VFDAEGIIWQQATLIPGARMYGDINSFPFIVFHYPPVYHLVVRGVTAFGIDPLVAGRSISLLASLVTGLVIASLAFRATRNNAGRLPSLLGAITSGLSFFCFFPVVAASPLMRVDMLAIGLSLLGVWCFTAPTTRTWLRYVAMALFVLATFTKQTSIIAPSAIMVVAVLVNPKPALKVLCFGLLLGAAGLMILTWSSNGGFLRHVLLYNINRYSLGLMAQQIIGQSRHLIFIALGFLSARMACAQLFRDGAWRNLEGFRRDLASSKAVQLVAVLVLYLALSTCTLFALGKSGATLAYFVEWMTVLSVLIGTLVATVASPQFTNCPHDARTLTPAFRLVLPLLLVVQVLASPASRYFGRTDRMALQQLEKLVERVRNASKPVLSDDMVLLMRGGKEVPLEPAIFSELASTGLWDERPLFYDPRGRVLLAIGLTSLVLGITTMRRMVRKGTTI